MERRHRQAVPLSALRHVAAVRQLFVSYGWHPNLREQAAQRAAQSEAIPASPVHARQPRATCLRITTTTAMRTLSVCCPSRGRLRNSGYVECGG